MLEQLEQLKAEALQALEEVQEEEALQAWKVKYVGRSAPFMNVFKQMGSLSQEERPLVGQRANEVRITLEEKMEERKTQIKTKALKHSLSTDILDITLPGRPVSLGRLHPYTQTSRLVTNIFADMGFQVFRSPEVETDEMNFQNLNFPLHHPARDMQDTCYTTNPDVLLRTHTSPGQIRAMRNFAAESPDNPPPVRVILPGMCYRFEQVSTRSELQFTQIEGLAVGYNITFGDLKGTLADFARKMFGQNVKSRFRANYFPFTEPSAEMDIECFVCGGEGCPVCKHTGWLEVLGCGMVHPNVLTNGGYDPEVYTGFAFGMGPERLTMLRHRITDIRNFWRNDMRFLEQF
ncbi:MAG: phenylalanine--tRNA ligase subunit alpha [Anaerolineales bacterium]|nr:phenylalanine--tRNA ligase subunit alpha [Anaerolineales bacterium]